MQLLFFLFSRISYTTLWSRSDRGVTMVFVLVFGVSVALMVAGLMTLLVVELGAVDTKVRRERALQIAESGMEYYKWFLNHYPTDVQNGTGTAGPYVVPYLNASGTREGQYTLTVTGNYACNELTSVDVVSRGEIDGFPQQSRAVSARWVAPSVAEFSNLYNYSAWFGPLSNVTGPIQSNVGARMFGAHASLVLAGASSWACTPQYGCSPTSSQAGVSGTGGTSSLWRYPTPVVSFYNIANLPSMKTRAQNYGQYYPKRTGTATARGYHVIFNSDGTYTVKTVSATSGVSGTEANGITGTDYHHITTEALLGTYTPPATCGVLFFEDRVWVEGTYRGKLTLVAADLTSSPNYDPDIIIDDNLTRSRTNGLDGLTLIAEHSIKVSYESPDNLNIEGIFIALTGNVARNYYNPLPIIGVPTSLRTAMVRVGTILSSDDGGFWWSSFGFALSGYGTQITGYDRTQAYNPPPFTPIVYPTPRYIRWREE